jgi:hypothetical protein
MTTPSTFFLLRVSFIIVILLCPSSFINAQIILKGRVITIDEESIPFVRIGIIETEVALMSDVNGHFTLEIPEKYGNELLTFQSPSFKTSSFSINELSTSADLQIKLPEAVTHLNDFVLSNKKLKSKIIGNEGKRKGSDVDIDFKDDINMAYAIKVEGRKEPFKIAKLMVYVKNPYPYPYYIRPLVMTYDNQKGRPSKDLISQNIYFEVQEGNGWMEMDLEEFNVSAEGDIVLGVEWLGTSGETPYFSISFDFGQSQSFRRVMTSDGFEAKGKSNWLQYNQDRKRPLIKAVITY